MTRDGIAALSGMFILMWRLSAVIALVCFSSYFQQDDLSTENMP
jgi:hypothetical protein